MTIRNLEYFFGPRSIAVIGASDRPHSVGETVLRNLLAGGFGGPVLPVNPKHRTLAGLPVYATVAPSGLTSKWSTSSPDSGILPVRCTMKPPTVS